MHTFLVHSNFYVCKESKALLVYHAARTQPFPVWDLRKWWVEAMDVVGRRAGVATQKLATVFTHSAKLHVVILFLTSRLLLILFLIFSLPLDSLFLLRNNIGIYMLGS